MLQIGQLEINGDGKWPKSRAAMKEEIIDLAESLELKLTFVTHKDSERSWCNVANAEAEICERVGGKLWRMTSVMHHAFHEIGHWIQFNEGMFQSFFGRPYYGIKWIPPTTKDRLRLALRVERHADWLSGRLATELFGVELDLSKVFYANASDAKEFFQKEYGGST